MKEKESADLKKAGGGSPTPALDDLSAAVSGVTPLENTFDDKMVMEGTMEVSKYMKPLLLTLNNSFQSM